MRALVIGLGRFGLPLAQTLLRRGWDVIGVDVSASAVERAKDSLPFCARADSMDEESLRELIGDGMDVAIVGIGQAFEATVMAVAILRDLGVKQVVARANSHREARILRLVGANQTVEIESEMGERLGRGLLSTGLVDFLPLDDEAALVEWSAPAPMWGKSLREINLRQAHGVTAVAIRPAGKDRWNFTPDPDQPVREGDVLMLLGPDERMEKLTG